MSMLTEKLWIFDQSSFKVAHIRQTFSRPLPDICIDSSCGKGTFKISLRQEKTLKLVANIWGMFASVNEPWRECDFPTFANTHKCLPSQWDRAFKETAILYNTVYPIADEYSNCLFILIILGRCRRGPFIHYLWLILVTSGALPNWGIEPATPVSQHWQQTALTSELKFSISLHQVWFN